MATSATDAQVSTTALHLLPLSLGPLLTAVLCDADPCPDPTTYVTEGGQYCDQATDDDTAAGKPPAPLSPPKPRQKRTVGSLGFCLHRVSRGLRVHA